MESLKNSFRFFAAALVTTVLASFFLVPALAYASNPGTIDIWWPTDGARITGTQPFKGLLSGKSLQEYSLSWSVDNGQENSMYDSYQDYPHKEAQVNVAGWNWRGNGPYEITLRARSSDHSLLATKTIKISIDRPTATSTPVPTTPTPVTVAPAPAKPAPIVVVAPTPIPVAVTQPVTTPDQTIKLYVDGNSSAQKQADAWKNSRPADSLVMSKLAGVASARWFGNWNQNITQDVSSLVSDATAKNATPILVAYNIPARDCGGYSAGGSSDAANYRAWIRGVAAGIGNKKAIVVLEPDALANIDCLSDARKNERYELLRDAVSVLKANSQTSVYLDAGNAHWVAADTMAARLTQAGIANANGFATNVSNFFTTNDTVSYANSISAKTGNKHYIIDTSRNGSGSNGEWCNPSGRSLGTASTLSTGNSLADGYLWLKTPGESDGACNGGPNAGVWWPDYALELAKRSGY